MAWNGICGMTPDPSLRREPPVLRPAPIVLKIEIPRDAAYWVSHVFNYVVCCIIGAILVLSILKSAFGASPSMDDWLSKLPACSSSHSGWCKTQEGIIVGPIVGDDGISVAANTAPTPEEWHPNRGDAQRCLIDEWLRKRDPHSAWLPENGHVNQPITGDMPCSAWEKK